MYSRILTGSLYGLSGGPTWAEVDCENGLPAFSVVGLADQSVKEARERIRAALENSGLRFPAKRITVNLTPANRKKEGSHYDLPVAAGIILCSKKDTDLSGAEDLSNGNAACLGELTLDGRVNAVDGVLPMMMGLKKTGVNKFFIPEACLKEAMLVKDAEIYPVRSVVELSDHMTGMKQIKSVKGGSMTVVPKAADVPDFLDIRGQEVVKRAAQIAAAGMHGMLMVGPPGTGKTMIGKRIPGILPRLSYDEMLEVTQIYSAAGETGSGSPLVCERPFRAPHHSVTKAALIGGGGRPRPGEISLAHEGVLFLDEIAEFPPYILDLLRQPLEDGFVVLNRLNYKVTFPSKFMLVAAMNPCRCGYYGDPEKQCNCTETDRNRYTGRISGPLMDRIDIHVSVSRPRYGEINVDGPAGGVSSAQLRDSVVRAMDIQKKRYADEGIKYNSQLGAKLLEKYCVPDAEGREKLRESFEKMHLSARGYHRVLKIARTIADLQGSRDIGLLHITEALAFRFPADLFGDRF